MSRATAAIIGAAVACSAGAAAAKRLAPGSAPHARSQAHAPRRGTDPTQSERPPLTSAQVELEIESRERSIGVDRKRAIALIEEFIAKHAANRAMSEALYRLAALYWERSQSRFLADMESWAAGVDRCKADPEACPDGPAPEPQLDLRQSQAIYARLIGDYPQFRKIDTVHYLYGFSLRDQGQPEAALDQFWAIIRRHPGSSFAPDAWLAVGDHRFYADNDFASALQAYESVLNYPRSDSYALALFKSAWCHWKLGQTTRAVRRFKEVLDEGADPNTDDAGRKRLADLHDEALEYLVQVLSEDESNQPKDIYAFLASIDGERYSRKVLVRLAEAYEAQTRYDKSVPTYRFLIGLASAHPDNADFGLHVFIGLRGEGELEPALQALRELHRAYGPGTAWAKAHPAEANVASGQAQALHKEFARGLHESAQAAERDTEVADKQRYGLTARAYEDFIARYPATKDAVELSYLVGDIYAFKLASQESAGDAYLRVGESAPVGPLHRDALLAAINAFESAMEAPAAPLPARDAAGTEPAQAEPQEPGPKPTARTPLARKFVRSVDLFTTLFPADDENGAVVYKLGDYLYANGDYDGAVARFGRVALDYPRSANAGAAGDRILESLGRAKDYESIELWANKLKLAPAFAEPDEQGRLDRIIVQSLLKQGESLGARGYWDRAAGYYLRMAREYPEHEQAPIALQNAGASLERAGQAQAATAVYARLATEHRGTAAAADATLVVARVYENMGDYANAATHYDELVKNYPSHPGRADALYNAGVIHQALGNASQAVDRYQRYAKAYAGRDDATDATLRAAEVLTKNDDRKRAAALLQAFVRAHPRGASTVRAYTLLGQVYGELGKVAAAERALGRAVALGRDRDGPSRVHAAHARYLQGETLYRRFEAAELDAKPAKLRASLQRKATLLGQAKDIYLDVLTHQSAEWSTAALYRIGEAYETFAASLRKYPIPKNLSDTQQDAYSEQLDTFALAFEEEAIGAYRTGYLKARELKIYNAYTRQIREALGRLSSQEYPPLHEIGADFIQAEGTGGGGRPVRTLAR